MEGGNEELINGYRASIWRDEKISGDWLHYHVKVLNTTELYTLKMAKMINMYILPQ